MKKKLLFVMPNLNCGGAEKALISLLESLDFSVYDVDLYLFKHEGLFFSKIPNEVKVLPAENEFNLFDMPFKQAFKKTVLNKNFKSMLARIKAGIIFKTEKNRSRCEQRVWKYISPSFNSLITEYDIAIGYLEKNPIFFCVDKVIAKRKIGFIHNDYNQLGMDPNLDEKYFDKLDVIVTVSKECSEVLKNKFPKYVSKIEVMHNIVSKSIIDKMSREDINSNSKAINIISIGRLTYQKGYELAINACKKLIDKGFDIEWNVIGEGEERSRLEEMIRKNNLEKNFFLLGLKENPYPYIKNSDIFVQTSRFEGKSIAIDEAKILRKPILVTNFSTVKDQIVHESNGIIVEMDPDKIANGIERLIQNDELREKLTRKLSNEKSDFIDELNIFHKILEA